MGAPEWKWKVGAELVVKVVDVVKEEEEKEEEEEEKEEEEG